MARPQLLEDASRSIAGAFRYTLDAYGEAGLRRYTALISQAISDFATAPIGSAVRTIGAARRGRVLLLYDLVSSRANAPMSIGRVARPRHFLVGRLDGNVLHILFLAHDSMAPENVLQRSRHADARDD